MRREGERQENSDRGERRLFHSILSFRFVGRSLIVSPASCQSLVVGIANFENEQLRIRGNYFERMGVGEECRAAQLPTGATSGFQRGLAVRTRPESAGLLMSTAVCGNGRLHVTTVRRWKTKARTPSESSRDKVRAHRKRLRQQGLRPIQIWVPDMRSPAFVKAAHRQSLAVAKSPHATEVQDFVDAISDWGSR